MLFVPQNSAELLFLISPGYYSHLKKNWRQCVYKMFGGQTRCITGDVQMEE